MESEREGAIRAEIWPQDVEPENECGHHRQNRSLGGTGRSSEVGGNNAGQPSGGVADDI